jgi:hypothetical protein
LVGTPGGKRPLGRLWENNIKMGLTEKELATMEHILLVRGRNECKRLFAYINEILAVIYPDKGIYLQAKILLASAERFLCIALFVSFFVVLLIRYIVNLLFC